MSKRSSHSSSRPSSRPARPHSAQDWEEHKDIIRQLYWEEDRGLTTVIGVMKDRHGFSATVDSSELFPFRTSRPKQYKTVLKRWGFEKNVKSSDMQHIVRISKRRRELENKDTEFLVRDRPVPSCKIERWMGRTEFDTDELADAEAHTPPDIRYRTPIPDEWVPSPSSADQWAASGSYAAEAYVPDESYVDGDEAQSYVTESVSDPTQSQSQSQSYSQSQHFRPWV